MVSSVPNAGNEGQPPAQLADTVWAVIDQLNDALTRTTVALAASYQRYPELNYRDHALVEAVSTRPSRAALQERVNRAHARSAAARDRSDVTRKQAEAARVAAISICQKSLQLHRALLALTAPSPEVTLPPMHASTEDV